LRKSVLVILATILVIGFVGCRPDQQTAPSVAESVYDNYAGSEACGGCHSAIYSKFVQSGHPYKLTQVVNTEKPMVYPFTTLPDIPNTDGLKDGDNTLGPPNTYGDVSWVIGGYKWKARWVDLNGYIITGSDVQYNFENRSFTAYNSGSVDLPYNCGKCHTTGWIPFSEGGIRKNDLPGMDGNFYAGGVHCEECHGEGRAHVNTHGDKQYINVDRTSELCGRCHTRDSQKRIAASGGYIQHHEQYDELLGKHPDGPSEPGWGKHLAAGVGCGTCHDPHASTVHQAETPEGTPGVIKDCVDCHADKVIVTGAHSQESLDSTAGMPDQIKGKKLPNCVLCHMPKLTKSAVGHAKVGTGPGIGDISTHIFKIDLSKGDQFTPDGKFAYPWLTPQYACKQCHNGVHFFDLPIPVQYQVHRYN